MAGCTTKIQMADTGEILRCVRQAHDGDDLHRDWMVEFRKIDDETWEVQRFALEVTEV